MAITMQEKPDSRSWTAGSRRRCEHRFLLAGTSDDIDIRDYVEQHTGLFYDTCVRTDIQIEPEFVDDDTDTGRWTATVAYEELPVTVSFEGNEGSVHITQSLQTVHKYAPAGKTPPDFAGAIGVAGSDVEGVDIVAPTFDFTISVLMVDADVTLGYLQSLRAAQGKVNSVPYTVTVGGLSWQFAAGELLMRRVSATKRGAETWEINALFSASENQTNIVIGSGANEITIAAKWGWEYLWVLYDGEVDAAATPPRLTKRPVAAYVEKVYRTAVFPDIRSSVPTP